jgi:hypothetical protein
MSGLMPVGSLQTLAEVQQRLAALRVELQRLERDEAVFARAFHTYVAQAVYDTLVEDEARLAAEPTLELTVCDLPAGAVRSIDLDSRSQPASGACGAWEILDL